MAMRLPREGVAKQQEISDFRILERSPKIPQ